MERLKVQVELNSDVQAQDPRIEAADVVICATGSHAFLPPIKGIEYGVTAVDVLKGGNREEGSYDYRRWSCWL